MKDDQRLLSVREAAARLRVGYNTMRTLIKAGKVAVVRLPGRRSYLVDPHDLESLIDGSRVVSKLAPQLAPSDEVIVGETHENLALPEQRQASKNVYEKGWNERVKR